MVEAEAADVHAEEIEIIDDDEEEGADSAASQVIGLPCHQQTISYKSVNRVLWQRRRPLMCMLKIKINLWQVGGRRYRCQSGADLHLRVLTCLAMAS